MLSQHFCKSGIRFQSDCADSGALIRTKKKRANPQFLVIPSGRCGRTAFVISQLVCPLPIQNVHVYLCPCFVCLSMIAMEINGHVCVFIHYY